MTNLDDTIWRHAKDHPDYYVNRLGDVFSKRQSDKGRYITKRILGNNDDRHNNEKTRHYVKLFKSFAGSNECDWVPVDRLVAFAFVKNPDPEKFTNVIHLDGNYKNDNASNLKWGEPEKRNKSGHPYARKPVRAINTKTNEVINFDSIAEAASYLGCDPTFVSHHLRRDGKASLYHKIWKFEYVNPSDNTGCYHPHSIAVIALNMKTNEEIICPSGVELAKKIGITTWMVSVYRDTPKLAKGEWLIESYNKETKTTEKKEEKTMSYIPVPTSKEEPKVENPLTSYKQVDEFQKARDAVAKIHATKTLAKTKPVIDPDEICKKMMNGLYNLPPQDTDSAALNGWMLGYADCMNIVIEALKEVKK